MINFFPSSVWISEARNDMRRSIVLCGLLLLMGCANQPSTKTTVTPTIAAPAPSTQLSEQYQRLAPDGTRQVEPKYIRADSVEAARTLMNHYLENGYRYIGYDSFSELNVRDFVTGGYAGVTESDIMDQAKRVGADVVICGSNVVGRETVNQPALDSFSTGANATAYFKMIPTEVTRTGYWMGFFALP
jgi:hypothetical protein